MDQGGLEVAATEQTGPLSDGGPRRLVVYTAIAGDYDSLQSPAVQSHGVEFVCFADAPSRCSPGWTYRPLPRAELAPPSRNRWAKMHPHLLLAEYDASIYIDGNIAVVGDLRPLAAQALSRSSLGLYGHPVRDCLYEEALECARIGFDSSAAIRRQVCRYAAEGFPRRYGLLEANVIIRAHHEKPVIRAMDRWWQEWEHGVKRDQLSLMYALWKEDLVPLHLGAHDGRNENRYFRYLPHRHPLGRPLTRTLRQIANRLDLLLSGDPASGVN